MAIRQTFHTPSFGDEEFEILSTPTFDQQQQQQQHQHQQQSLLLQRQSNVNTIEQTSSSSLHSIVPAVTNQSTNQWQTHTTDSGYFENSVAMEDAAIMPTDEGDANSVTIATALTKTKKKRESNEPTKPISAYALFFRDTQAAIKGQNPDASFEEISKIVASMWDALDPEHKNVYKKKTELAKKEYLKLLAVYRASQINKEEESDDNVNAEEDEIQNNTNAIINSVSNNSTFIQEDTSASPSGVNVVKIARIPTQNPTTATVPTQSNTQSINSSNSGRIATPIGNNQPSITEIPLRQNNNFLTDSNDIASVSRNHSTNIVETNQQLQKCIREGCSNKAIINPDWEDEYCSNECVIIHCRDVFSQWIQSNLQQPNLQQSNLQTA